MDQYTLNSIILVRKNLERARIYCCSYDYTDSTLAVRATQDALEDAFRACLVYKGKYPSKKQPNFYDFLEEIRKIIKIPEIILEIGNKLRAISKHAGYITDPRSAQEFYTAANETICYLIQQVFDKDLLNIYCNELIENKEIKEFLNNACQSIEKNKIYESLLYIRQAFFKCFEEPFSIASFEDNNSEGLSDIFYIIHPSPPYTKNKEFIEKEVNTPFDYIQYDFQKIEMDLLKYGIFREDFFNVYRLTPRTFFCKKNECWKSESKFKFESINKEKAQQILLLTVNMIRKKEQYQHTLEGLDRITREFITASPTKLYKKASLDSEVLREIPQGEKFQAEGITPPLKGETPFIKIDNFKDYNGKTEWILGFILMDDGKFTVK